MRIEVIEGAIQHDGGLHVAGTESAVFEIKDDKEAKRLIDLGKAKAVKGRPPSETAAEKKAREEAEAAAEARAVLEAKAVEKGAGTAEEVAKLSDDELAELLKEAAE
ncbi:MAG: hypothetical protein KKB59_10540 [Spirochaetes bacterium]|nr:hypothetical protein [Spirochaetota bacterium]